jgi:hypothetical protein
MYNAILPPLTLRIGQRTMASNAIPQPSRHERARFQYLKKAHIYECEKPFNIAQPSPQKAPGQRDSNLVWEVGAPEQITDIRGHESKFELDKQGFAVRTWPTILSQRDFDNSALIEHAYAQEIRDMIKSTVDGADLVVAYHAQVWTSRLRIGLSDFPAAATAL